MRNLSASETSEKQISLGTRSENANFEYQRNVEKQISLGTRTENANFECQPKVWEGRK